MPASETACSLMVSESYSSALYTETAVILRPPSLTYDDCMNVVSDKVSKGLEEGKDSRSNALELVRLLDAQEVSIKEENNMVEAEAPRVVVEGEQDDFPELPLLRGDCVLTSSNIGIGAEVEYMSRMFDDGRDCDGSDNSFLVSLRFDVDGPLVDVGGDLPKQRDGFFCPPLPWECAVASVVLNGISTEGRQEGSSNKLNFDNSSGDVTNLGDKSKDNDQLFGIQNDMGLPLHSSRKLKDTCKVINSASSSKTDTRHKKTEEEVLGTPYIDNEASCSAEGSTGEPTDCSGVERSTTEKLSSAEFDTKGSTFDSFKRTSTCCSIDNDNCTGDKILPRVIANSSSLTSVRRTNPKRAASLRSNLADEKSHSLIRIHSNQRKYRSKFGASTSCTPMTLKMFSGVSRKIRSLQRKARLSVWGTVESLCTIIKQWDELMMHDSLPTAARRSKSKKARRFFNRRKITAALKNKESRLFSTKIPHQSIPPSMLVAQPSLENGIENVMPTSDCHIGTSSTKVELEWNFAEKWYAVVRPNIREVQEEKDLESTLTQETSSDNIISECHGVSSQVDPEFVTETIDDEHPSDPGNSPDSDVYNPITDVSSLTFEGSPITKRRFTLNKNFQIQESKEESCLTSVAPNFMKPIVAHLPFLTRQIHACEDQKSGHREKKKFKQKNERKGKTKKRGDKSKREKMLKKAAICECPFLISDPSSGEGKLESKAKSNEVRIASLSSSCSPNCQEGDRGGKCSIVSRGQCEIGSNTERLLIYSSVSGSVDLNKFTQNRTVINNPLQNDCNEQLEEILSSCHVKECQVCESGKEGLCKNKSNCADSTSHTRTFIYGHQKENILTFNNLREADGFPNGNDNLDFSLGTTNNVSLLGGETVAIDTLLKDETNDVATPVFSESTREPCISGHSFSGKKAWALCDDCEKWRCVPDELVHDIEKGRWTCKDNVDEAFADCSIPQEKTDEDINIDLGISDEQCFSTTQHNYGELAPLRQSATRTTWIPIKSNLFLHRNRRSQTIDEIMVCHCKPPLDGGLGCGEECLNRMLNIECVKGTCPCGNLCSNQQFQKRKYAKFKWLKCGKKGYGLQLEHNASSGQFLIEYVGEVLDLAAYEARLRYYASRGQKHFYFMTLNGGEVIDACEKGNLGRFINHSCDPNCRTEKWMVNGEVCIGLFAIRDIKKGEEITFDYNYVRVFGAAAKKCVCGSADCRGYIGGDPSNSEVIVQDDSDTEDPEPVMIEDGEIEPSVMGIDSVATGAMVAGNPSMPENGARFENHRSENEDAIQQLLSEHHPLDNQMQPSSVESESNMCRLSNINPLQDVKLGLSSKEPDHAFYEDINAGTQLTSVFRSLPHEQLSEGPQNTLKTLQQTDCGVHAPDLDDAINFSSQNSCRFMHNSSATCLTEEILTASKHNSVVKTLRHVKVKRSRVSIKSVASGKTKKVSTAISNRHIEGVEEKLNELLDEDGGIYRKKDAAKGYLKLLVVTAAAGDEIKGSMSQSARDLSLILDAILKTKSRMVLVDIINKNGLQMLHNIMKQNRDNFNRIPILRKLLKVLEFLAEKEILTIDHIHAPPPRCGMESFKESMLKLMKHRDTQVHLIARNFADQWLPRNFRRVEPSDRDGKQFCSDHSRSSWCQTSSLNSWDDHDKINAVNHQPSPQVDIHGEALPLPTPAASSSASFTNINPTAMAKPRKRKSRWDQPSDANEQASEYSADQLMMCSSSSVKLLKPSQLEPISDIEVPDKKSEGNYSSNAVICDDDEDDDELPPGFGSPRKDEFCQMASESSDITGDAVVVGHPQERYLAHLTVAYGMPISLMQHQVMDSANLFDPSSKIAPAMPFKPFPPLPAYPRQGPCLSNPTSRSFNGNPNYRHPKQQAGFPKYGNGRRFFHPPQWNSRQQPRRF